MKGEGGGSGPSPGGRDLQQGVTRLKSVEQQLCKMGASPQDRYCFSLD